MSFLIFLALFNGILISLSRILNARLGLHIGALRSSFWNHLVGFLFLIPVVFYFNRFSFAQNLQDIPLYAWTGGALGVVFVWSSSWLIPKLGLTQSTILVIAGQMIFSSVLDFWIGKIDSLVPALVGTLIIIAGVLLGKRRPS